MEAMGEESMVTGLPIGTAVAASVGVMDAVGTLNHAARASAVTARAAAAIEFLFRCFIIIFRPSGEEGRGIGSRLMPGNLQSSLTKCLDPDRARVQALRLAPIRKAISVPSLTVYSASIRKIMKKPANGRINIFPGGKAGVNGLLRNPE
jgi:hypothetical protein